jgi:hypothetical protein
MFKMILVAVGAIVLGFGLGFLEKSRFWKFTRNSQRTRICFHYGQVKSARQAL